MQFRFMEHLKIFTFICVMWVNRLYINVSQMPNFFIYKLLYHNMYLGIYCSTVS